MAIVMVLPSTYTYVLHSSYEFFLHLVPSMSISYVTCQWNVAVASKKYQATEVVWLVGKGIGLSYGL